METYNPSTLLDEIQGLREEVRQVADFIKELDVYKRQEIHIPDHITKIPNSFASWSPLLEKVNIPQSVIEIGSDAFGAAYKLKSIELPEGLKRIESDAFWYCAFDSIVFPASLEYLGGGSGANWKYIKKIYSRSPIPPFCEDVYKRQLLYGGLPRIYQHTLIY